MNPASDTYKDMVDPGWREREAENGRKFLEALTPRHQAKPIGECHAQLREQCDILDEVKA